MTKPLSVLTRRAVLVLLFGSTVAFAAKDSIITAVRAQADPGYQRAKMPDGSFKRETYAISRGGAFPGTLMDREAAKISFPTIAGVVARYLATQNYFLARDAASADLLLVIHWGTTIPFNDISYGNSVDGAGQAMANFRALSPPQTIADRMSGRLRVNSPEARAAEESAENAIAGMLMENRFRDMKNERNAKLLGYLDEINNRDNPSRWAGAGSSYDDLRTDIEEERYYVVVSAYDFRAATKENKQKLRWVTRISISSSGNSFEDKLAAMVASAAKQFGQNSDGLLRQYRPDTSVDLGEIRYLGIVPDQPAPVTKDKGK